MQWTKQTRYFYITFYIINWYLAIANSKFFLFLKFNQTSLCGYICLKWASSRSLKNRRKEEEQQIEYNRPHRHRHLFKNKSSSIPLKDICIEKSFVLTTGPEDTNTAWSCSWSIITQYKMDWWSNKISVQAFKQYIFTYTLVFVWF